jgi:hypothetical protein
LGFPGKLIISVLPRIPAVARDSALIAVCFRPSSYIVVTRAGVSRSITLFVASGVTSVGAKPVPPVVTIRLIPSSDHLIS